MTDLTVSGLGQQISDLISNDLQRDQQFRDWVTGVPGGGPTNNGNYPLTDRLGVTHMVPCPAQMVAVTQKGEPAKNDLGFFFQGQLGAGELLAAYQVTGMLQFTVANTVARAGTPPSQTSVITINRRGTDNSLTQFATVTFTPGVNVAQVAFSTGQTTVVSNATVTLPLQVGEVLELTAPATHDQALADVSITLAGA